MKRVYSGYWSEEKKQRRSSFRPVQMIPIVAVLAVFLMFTFFKDNQKDGGDGEFAGAIRFYFACESEGVYDVGYVDRELNPGKGSGIVYSLEKGLKEIPPGTGYIKALADNVYINSISTDGRKAVVDLSALPAGGSGNKAEDEALLKAIAYTVGNYFNVAAVTVSVGGELYSGGEVELDTGLFK